jgi:biopolymer transport protein ExbD
MLRSRRKMKKTEKINLIPIMDAVFIFNFFLLMSAQFINVHEIGSSVPMVREVAQVKDEKPLNLVLEVDATEVRVKKGRDGALVRAFNDEQWRELSATLMQLKKGHPHEKVAQIRSAGKVPFHRIVKVIDHAKEDSVSKTRLFEEIVFDGKGVI